jgi:hypothetical protein
MIRGGSRTGRIARLLACVLAALAIAPAAAMAQSAVDEYTLDIPGGGGGGEPADPGGSAGAAAAGTEGSSGGPSSTTGSGGGGADTSGSDASGATAQGEDLSLNPFHDGSGASGNISANAPLDTSSRSAPEVVADTLFDGATLPILAALVLITGVGAWRVLRQRGTLSGQAG